MPKSSKKKPRLSLGDNSNFLGRIFSNFGRVIDWIFKYNVSIVFLSLIASLILFYYVTSNSDNFVINNAYSRQVLNVPVEVQYDEENRVIDYYVDGVQIKEEDLKVDVIFTGSRNDVLKIINNENYKFIIDASSLSYGMHNGVKVEMTSGLEGVNVTINPDIIDLEVSRYVTKKVELQSQTINSSNMADNLTVNKVSISEQTVLISGAESRVNSVDYVAVLVDLGQVLKEGETAISEPVFKAYNSSGDIVDVDFETNNLSVTVDAAVESFEKDVRIVFEGELPEGKAIGNYTIEPSKVSVSGTREQILEISYIEATVNVNDLVNSNQTTAKLKVPPGINYISVESVSVLIELEDKESKAFEKVPIGYTGIGSQFTPTLNSETDKYAEVVLTGAPSVLSSITIEDIVINADLSEVTEAGEYTVSLVLMLDDTRIEAELLTQQVTVVVSEN